MTDSATWGHARPLVLARIDRDPKLDDEEAAWLVVVVEEDIGYNVERLPWKDCALEATGTYRYLPLDRLQLRLCDWSCSSLFRLRVEVHAGASAEEACVVARSNELVFSIARGEHETQLDRRERQRRLLAEGCSGAHFENLLAEAQEAAADPSFDDAWFEYAMLPCLSMGERQVLLWALCGRYPRSTGAIQAQEYLRLSPATVRYDLPWGSSRVHAVERIR